MELDLHAKTKAQLDWEQMTPVQKSYVLVSQAYNTIFPAALQEG